MTRRIRWSAIAMLVSLAALESCGSSVPEELEPGAQQAAGYVRCPLAGSTTFPTALPQGATAAVGAIPGSFHVGSSGDPVYSMAIEVPPGPNGMEPALKLTYQQGVRDSYVGQGFAVEGFSTISRCPLTLARDGVVDSVHYDLTDNFCLDGKKLLHSEAQGPTQDTFKTIPDDIAKITADLNPAHDDYVAFHVFRKDGTRIDYSTQVSSTRKRSDGTNAAAQWLITRTWSLKTAATVNYSWTSYFGAAGETSEYEPNSIAYAGRTVLFNYVPRSDAARYFQFFDGATHNRSVLLDSISTYASGTPVYAYHFSYATGASTGRTLLTDVKQCTVASGVCKPPTHFDWNSGHVKDASVWTKVATPIAATHYLDRATFMVMDVTGDGLDDVITSDAVETGGVQPLTRWSVANNVGSGQFFPSLNTALDEPMLSEPTPLYSGNLDLDRGFVVDVNQDGLNDILLYDVEGSFPNWQVLVAARDAGNHVTFTQKDTGVQRVFPSGQAAPHHLSGPTMSAHVADLNGDGVADLIQCAFDNSTQTYTWTVNYWSPSAGAFDPTRVLIQTQDLSSVYPTISDFQCDSEAHVVDLNGDGRSDLVLWNTAPASAINYRVLMPAATGWFHLFPINVPAALPQNAHSVFADLNGDGLPDVVQESRDGTNLSVFINHGNAATSHLLANSYASAPTFAAAVNGLPTQSLPFPVMLGLASTIDVNGDGRQDLLVPLGPVGNSAPSWVVFRATGTIDNSGQTPLEMLPTPFPADPTLIGGSWTLSYPLAARVSDVNGDGAQDVVLFANNTLNVFLSSLYEEDSLRAVTDGNNARSPGDPQFLPNVTLTYGHLVDGTITDGVAENDAAAESRLYVSRADAHNTCAYPRRCVVGPQRVVSGYVLNNGNDVGHNYGLHYRDGRADKRGRGWLGFGMVVTLDTSTNAGRVEVFDNAGADPVFGDYAGALIPIQVRNWTRQDNGALAGVVEEDITDEPRVANYSDLGGIGTLDYFAAAPTTTRWLIEGTYVPNGGLTPLQWVLSAENLGTVRSKSTETRTFYDFAEVITSSASTYGLDPVTTRKNQFYFDTANWVIAGPTVENVCSTVAGVDQCYEIDRGYDTTGKLISEKISGADLIARTTRYTYDPFANVTSGNATDTLGNSRSMCVSWDNAGVFPYAIQNGLGQTWYVQYDQGFGNLIALKDPNLHVSQWSTDGFGRSAVDLRSDGTQTTTTYKPTQDPVHGNVLQIVSAETGGQNSVVQVDELGRETVRWSFAPTRYCAAGCQSTRVIEYTDYETFLPSVARRSEPVPDSTPIGSVTLWNTWGHDFAGRVVKYTAPWANAVTTYSYYANSVDIAEPGGVGKTVDRDARLRIRTVTEGSGATSYNYGSFDRLTSVVAPDNTTTKYVSDALGRVLTKSTPDQGTATASYNGFGNVISVVDAASRSVKLNYDGAGRLIHRADNDGVVIWTWDVGANAAGKLSQIDTAPSDTSPFTSRRSYSYDANSKPSTSSLTLGSETFTVSYAYDLYDRLSSITYPAVAGFSTPFMARQLYDAHGYVNVVTDGNYNSLWTLSATDTVGRDVAETFGNGVLTKRSWFPDSGRVQSITSSLSSTTLQSLQYTWDNRLRLTSRFDGLLGKTEQFGYDGLDRVTCAGILPATCTTSVGYDAGGNITNKTGVGAYTYDPNHPHAVNAAGSSTFGYDAVGNQISRPGASISYTAFNLPKTISLYLSTVSYVYDGTESRVRRTELGDDTVYLDSLFERVTQTNGTVHAYHSVYAGTRLIAIMDRSGGAQTAQYIQPDHLGSPALITSSSGAVLEKRSYDAFGQRRGPDWVSAYTGGPSAQPAAYTQQHDDVLGLIHMKGRTYDPVVGRFLQPDPFVPSPLKGQSWNLYSYVLNNPLTLLDPTGFDEDGIDYTDGKGTHRIGPPVEIKGDGPSKPKPTDSGTTKSDQAPSSTPQDTESTGTAESTDYPMQLDDPRNAGGSFLFQRRGDAVVVADQSHDDNPSSPIADDPIIAPSAPSNSTPFHFKTPSLAALVVAVAIPLSGILAKTETDLATARVAKDIAVDLMEMEVTSRVDALLNDLPHPDLPPRAVELLGDLPNNGLGLLPNVTVQIPNASLLSAPPARGLAPIGADGFPVELHHILQTQDGPVAEMTRTAHRGKGNFKANHPNTGQLRSLIDRELWDVQRRLYWEQQWDSGRFKGM